jgi:hypothetical protein
MRIRGCRRRSAHSVRCKFVMSLPDGKTCRNAKVTVGFRHRASRRIARRFHRRWLRCSKRPAGSGRRLGTSRLYSDTSPINRPIPAGTSVDPRSGVMVQQLQSEIEDRGWPIATGAWTNTVYFADASTPRYDVALGSRSYSGRRLMRVPIPDEARVPPDEDAGVVVIDRSSGCEYDFARAKRTGSGWSAWFANALPTGGRGIYPYAEAPSASGFANAAGMIMPGELEAGRIEHALVFTMHHTKAGGPVPPATGSDGWSDAPGAIPEGARLQLDPSLDLERLGLEPWERVIARALQKYGMFLIDTGGAVALRAQHSLSTSYRYPWGDGLYGQMPRVLARHMRVLKLEPQFETKYKFVPNECAALN